MSIGGRYIIYKRKKYKIYISVMSIGDRYIIYKRNNRIKVCLNYCGQLFRMSCIHALYSASRSTGQPFFIKYNRATTTARRDLSM